MRHLILSGLLLASLAVSMAEERCMTREEDREVGLADLREACSQADLVLVGTLGDLEPFTLGEGQHQLRGFRGKIQVAEILYGRGSAGAVPLLWQNPLAQSAPKVDHSGNEGKRRIWILTKDADGTWHADQNHWVRPLEDRPEVEKTLQDRLAPALKVLEASDSLKGEGEWVRPPAEWEACDTLGNAGPAAFPSVRRLLAAPSPVQRSWGCRAVGALKDRNLAKDLETLLGDATPLNINGCEAIPTTVGKQALEALGSIAGRTFADLDEGRAWIGKLGYSPEHKGE